MGIAHLAFGLRRYALLNHLSRTFQLSKQRFAWS
jgi:hypothetical protein